MNTREGHSDLVATLGTKVLGYSTLTRWLHEAQLDQFSETAVDFTENTKVGGIDEAILSALEVQPIGSRLHLRCIPRVLTEAQKRTRVSSSKQLLTILQEQQGSSWRDLVCSKKT
jgi:hypothetical protein